MYNVEFRKLIRSAAHELSPSLCLALSLSLLSASAYTDPDLSFGTRNIDFKFRTVKTPELRYDPRLLINKGVRKE